MCVHQRGTRAHGRATTHRVCQTGNINMYWNPIKKNCSSCTLNSHEYRTIKSLGYHRLSLGWESADPDRLLLYNPHRLVP